MNDLICIGKISKTHGVKGAVVLNLINSDSRSIQKDSIIYFKAENSLHPQKIISISYGNKIIIIFENFNTMNDAQKIVGQEVFMAKNDLKKKLLDDEYLINDILSFDVCDQQSRKIGQVIGFYSNGVQEIMVVQSSVGKKIEIPMIKEFIIDINFDEKNLIVKMMEYL